MDRGFDWMLAPLVWLVLLGGMLLSMEAGMRLHASCFILERSLLGFIPEGPVRSPIL